MANIRHELLMLKGITLSQGVIMHVAGLQCKFCKQGVPTMGTYRVLTSWWWVVWPIRVSSSRGAKLYFQRVFSIFAWYFVF